MFINAVKFPFWCKKFCDNRFKRGKFNLVIDFINNLHSSRV